MASKAEQWIELETKRPRLRLPGRRRGLGGRNGIEARVTESGDLEIRDQNLTPYAPEEAYLIGRFLVETYEGHDFVLEGIDRDLLEKYGLKEPK